LTDEFGKILGTITTIKSSNHPLSLPFVRDIYAEVRLGVNPKNRRLPAHPSEPSYPCYLSILGELAEVTPHGESFAILNPKTLQANRFDSLAEWCKMILGLTFSRRRK